MTYRSSSKPRFECGRGHAYTGPIGDPTSWYCIKGECGYWSGKFVGEEAEMRRVRAVFGEHHEAEKTQ